MNKVLVLLSGGQDSITCLGLALKYFDHVTAIGMDYGQRHKIELESAADLCNDFGIHYELMKIPSLTQINDSALLDADRAISAPHPSNLLLPASFVPNRNALFLTLAHAYAQKIKADTIMAGMCQTDYSGYPDCRRDFIDLLEMTLNSGAMTTIRFETPLMFLTKAETFQLAKEVGFLTTVIEDSHTCYIGDRTELHEWGYGCGECPACKLRKNGYEAFRAKEQRVSTEKETSVSKE